MGYDLVCAGGESCTEGFCGAHCVVGFYGDAVGVAAVVSTVEFAACYVTVNAVECAALTAGAVSNIVFSHVFCSFKSESNVRG